MLKDPPKLLSCIVDLALNTSTILKKKVAKTTLLISFTDSISIMEKEVHEQLLETNYKLLSIPFQKASFNIISHCYVIKYVLRQLLKN